MTRSCILALAVLASCTAQGQKDDPAARRKACEADPGCVWIGTLNPGESVTIPFTVPLDPLDPAGPRDRETDSLGELAVETFACARHHARTTRGPEFHRWWMWCLRKQTDSSFAWRKT